jgi:hypothetical protein
MAAKELSDLVRRRLWELGRSTEDASRRSRRILSADAIARIARSGGTSFISEGVAQHLAKALDVPETRVRRAAGLPVAPDPRESMTTRPHLRLVPRLPEDQASERTT